MRKSVVFTALFVLSGSFQAQATTQYLGDNKSALIYFKANAETVQAALCQNVEMDAAIVLGREIRESGKISSQKCELVSKNGITKASLEARLPEIKAALKEAITLAVEALAAFLGNAAGKSADEVQMYLKKQIAPQHKAIDAVTADQLFAKLLKEASNPMAKLTTEDGMKNDLQSFKILSGEDYQ